MSDPEATTSAARSRISVLTEPECVEILASTPIGRVVFVDDAHPIALPVNYRWYEGCVVFRALEGTTLHAAVLEAPVSFEADHWDEHAHTGASVVARGRATEVTDWADKAQLEELGILPWAGDPWREVWIRITPTEITGRRIS